MCGKSVVVADNFRVLPDGTRTQGLNVDNTVQVWNGIPLTMAASNNLEKQIVSSTTQSASCLCVLSIDSDRLLALSGTIPQPRAHQAAREREIRRPGVEGNAAALG